jgi:hypothetical protein
LIKERKKERKEKREGQKKNCADDSERIKYVYLREPIKGSKKKYTYKFLKFIQVS